MIESSTETDPAETLVRQLDVTADWLGTRPVDQFADGKRLGTVPQRVCGICQSIVSLQLGLAPRAYGDAGGSLKVPVLRGHALGAQVRVIGAELIAVMRSVSASELDEHAEALEQLSRELVALRSVT